MRRIFSVFLFIMTIACGASAQEILKHPRVVELEDGLKNSAAEYIKARFPNSPFMVSVKVDPLRRDLGRSGSKGYNDELPYYSEDEDEEMRDEWDNPQVPLGALINRVKRINVSIAVPSALKETEVNELKEGIYSVLHLTQARDEVEISRREWESEKFPWLLAYVAAVVLISLLSGLLLINRTSANRIARALSELKIGSQGGATSAAPQVVPESEAKAKDSPKSHELKFNDPIKMKELASRHIEFLTASPAFPNHRDIFALDRLGKEHPEKLGAVLSEFPADMQKKIFSYSSAFHWIEALNEPGLLDFECLEIFQSLIQNLRSELEMDWCHTIMATWRLGEHRNQFLKSLSKDEAFALLFEMPKAIAVSEARKAFPGSWAAILDPEFKPAKISPKRSGEIREGAIRILPLHEIELVKKYRDERELLEYLKAADPSEERDIYGAAPESSLIHSLRPPFYPIFDQDADTLRWIAPLIGLDQWALAVFNVNKSDRHKIDEHFSEKQRFLFVEKLKNFDANPPSKSQVGSARETVGRTLKKWLSDKAEADSFNGEKAEDHAA